MLNKILAFYTKYFAVWVVIFAVAAYFFPAPFTALQPWNKWFFAVTMFGIGAVLSADDFKHIIKNPVIVLIGACAQFIIMPFGAFLLAKAFGLPAEAAAGLILAGAAPDAMAGNVMSYVAKADTAYAVSLYSNNAGMSRSHSGPYLSACRLTNRNPILGYAHRRSPHCHNPPACRLCHKTLLQKTSGKNPSRLPRFIIHIHRVHLRAGCGN